MQLIIVVVLVQCESTPPPKFYDIFPKLLGIFSPNFTRVLCVPIYAELQIFIQLSATLTKLRHINATTIICSKCSPYTVETHAGWSHLIWHNVATVRVIGA